MKPTNPKITWQPYPATRPTEPGNYFVTVDTERTEGRVTSIFTFDSKRGRFSFKRRDDNRISAWAPLTNDATASAVTGMRCRARKSSLGMKMLVITEFSASAMASTTEFMKSA